MQFLQGVGPARAKHLGALGIGNIRDLIEHYPFRHQLIPRSIPIGALTEGVVATLIGTVQRIRAYGRAGDKTVYAQLVDGTGQCRVRWFHSEHLLERLQHGMVVRLSGTVELRNGLAGITNPSVEYVNPREPLASDKDRWEPVYPASAHVTSKQIARLVEGVLDRAVSELSDPLPDDLRVRRRLPPLKTAVVRYHQPTNATDVAIARSRLAYDELLLAQLALQLARRLRDNHTQAAPIRVDERLDQRIRKRIPFELTAGQDKAVSQIRADLARNVPMNRLLQGDVGCGKTAVAVYAALAAIANGQQVALLAPTEVLASQHATKIAQYLKGSRVRTAFVSGATRTNERAQTLDALQKGEVDFLIGTHAVLEKNVRFARLGLAIIDEQQKFGVAQRLAMRTKGTSPHVLVLSATPIPRTLAMAVLGDLDISTIQGMPAERKAIRTRLIQHDAAEEAWRFVRSRLVAGEQAYVVYPLIDESDAKNLRAATTEMEKLRATHFAGFETQLLHGRMKAAQKDQVMRRFRAGQVKVLVSTTVIEVGVDVPHATVIAIQHADRFGLSQLHQLRGRVGRGSKESHCLLFSDTTNELPLQRLHVLCATNDGFRIAEEDLRLRGPGELLGTHQHGVPSFKVADLIRDADMIAQARDDARTIIQADPHLREPSHKTLRQQLMKRYGESLRLLQVA